MHSFLRLRRWIAMLLLAGMGFAQASLAYAFCEMDRRELAQAMTAESGHDCACESDVAGQLAFSTNRCVAHCTADLQITTAFAGAFAAVPPAVAVLLLSRRDFPAIVLRSAEIPRPPGVPIRVLLHSFLI
ncbi:MAG: hypothetical protein ABI654_09920 [Betaproteobacteria bacterium]